MIGFRDKVEMKTRSVFVVALAMFFAAVPLRANGECNYETLKITEFVQSNGERVKTERITKL